MFIKRYLKEDAISLDLGHDIEVPEPEEMRDKDLWAIKEAVLERLVDLLEGTGQVGNRNRLVQDLMFRERKTSTALGYGIAVPHIRTQQARGFAMALGIVPGGLPFDSPDDQPVEVFVAMVAPPHDDKTYLKAYKALGEAFEADPNATRLALLGASQAGEVIRILADLA